jgi:diguanylate cyclase (GGDEF)-like protein
MIEFLCTLAGTLMGLGLGFVISQQLRHQTAAASKLETEQLRHWVSHLRSIASSMSAGVEIHNDRLENVNSALVSLDTGNPKVLEQAINALLETNKFMQQELQAAQSRIATQARAIEEVTAQARTDALTGASNRLAFNEALDDAVADFANEQRTTTLALLDIDRFKQVNDTYGHAVGDKVLIAVAKMLQEKLRGRGVVARYGGEEFSLLFTGCPAAWMVRVMEEARKAIHDIRIQTDLGELQVTCSVGMADLLSGDSATSLIARADQGLYQAKQRGRDRGYWCSQGEWLPMDSQPTATLWQPLQLDSKVQSQETAGEKANPKKSAADDSLFQLASECLDIASSAAQTAEDGHDSQSTRVKRVKSEEPTPTQPLLSVEEFTDNLQRSLYTIEESQKNLSLLSVRISNRDEILSRFGQEGLDECDETLLRAVRCSLRGYDTIGRTADGNYQMILIGLALDAVCYRAARIQLGINSASDGDTLQPVAHLKIQLATTFTSGAEDSHQLFARLEEAFSYETERQTPCVLVHDGNSVKVELHPLLVY